METPQIKYNPLIQLPDGAWVRPEIIKSITPLKHEHSHRPRVVVCYGDHDHAVIFCEDFDEAIELANDLSAQVNKIA